MPLRGGEDFLRRISESKSEDEFLDILIEGHKAGALVILGITDQDPKDLLACAQEFGNFKLVVDDRKYPVNDDDAE